MPAKELVVLRIKPNVIFVNVSVQLIGSEDFCDFDQLIIVIVSMEKRFLPEYLQGRGVGKHE